MKKRQLMAILLSAVMTVSACMPVTGISAFAAENADIGSTEAAVEEPASAEAAQEKSAPAESVTDPASVAEQEADSATEVTPEIASETEDTAETAAEKEADSEEAVPVESSEDEQAEDNTAEPEEEASLASTEESATAAEKEPAPTDAEETAVEDADAAATVSAPEEDPSPAQEAEVIEEDIQETSGKKAPSNADIPSANAFANAAAIAVGESKTATITENERYACLKFTPETSGNYKFYSEAEDDTWGQIYNSLPAKIAEDDESGGNSQFSVETFLIAGNTYYLAARYFYEYDTGSITVYLEKVEDSTPTFHVEGADSTLDLYAAPNSTVTMSVSAYSTSELTYTWYNDDGDDLNVNTSSYSITADAPTEYTCQVSNGDEAKWVVFRINIETPLKAYPDGGSENDTYINLEFSPYTEQTLKVIASAGEGIELYYEWEKDGETIVGANSDSYTISSVTENATYCCTVIDPYRNSKEVEFYVSVNRHLTVYPEGGEEGDRTIDVAASPNSELTLKVIVSADEGVELTYEWRKNWETIDGATTDSYAVPSVTESAEYRCVVSDPYGNSAYVIFNIYIENHLNAYPEGGSENSDYLNLHVSSKSSVTMRVIASAYDTSKLTYTWYNEGLRSVVRPLTLIPSRLQKKKILIAARSRINTETA